MSNTYTWDITGLECYPKFETETNVVFKVYWTLNATDGTYKTKETGVQELSYTSESIFIPFSTLTETIVIEWVKDALGTDKIISLENGLDKQLQSMCNATIITPSLPWEIV